MPRDRPRLDWLQKTFGPRADAVVPDKVRHNLTPDVAFIFRLNTKKMSVPHPSAPCVCSPLAPPSHQILLLARDDMKIAEGDSRAIAMGHWLAVPWRGGRQRDVQRG